MKVLITGGAGFIGSALVRHVLVKGCHVVNVDNFTYSGRHENLDDVSGDPNYALAQGDVCDQPFVDNVFETQKPDAVLHLAAESHVDRSIDDSLAFVKTNVLGTHTVVQAAIRHWDGLDSAGKEAFRYVQVSTDEVFGSLDDGGRFTEELPYQPNSPYAATKASADHLVRAAHKTFGLPTLICHPANNYGPRQFPEKLIPLCTLNALESETLPIYGDGKQIRDWIHVEDTVAALWAVLTQGHVGQAYCISAEDGRHNIDVVSEICRILDELRPKESGSYADQISHVADRAGHDTCYLSSAQKLKQATGWGPAVSFPDGLKTTIEWYLNNAPWWQPLQDARVRRGKRQGAT